uniref:Uncharacterized protein n=1 Tax=Trichuris muris TaxID=70415 RepID=A0A5S6R4X5_TRIMR
MVHSTQQQAYSLAFGLLERNSLRKFNICPVDWRSKQASQEVAKAGMTSTTGRRPVQDDPERVHFFSKGSDLEVTAADSFIANGQADLSRRPVRLKGLQGQSVTVMRPKGEQPKDGRLQPS